MYVRGTAEEFFYVGVKDGQIDQTKEFAHGCVVADYDERGDLLGVEVSGKVDAYVPDKLTQGVTP